MQRIATHALRQKISSKEMFDRKINPNKTLSCTVSHCVFSPNLFHGQIHNSKIYRLHEITRKQKMQPLKNFWIKPPSNRATFEQERPQRPRGETVVSTLHWSKNDIMSFFNFLQKKVSRLDKKVPAHICIILGVVI